MNRAQPYQPLLLRILHGLTGLSVIAAIVTAYWTYDTYDARWFSLSLPKYGAIEGIHGTFGLYALLIFPIFAIYAFRRGQRRLLQPNSLAVLTQVGKPAWWYTLHRAANTLAMFALAFAVFSGKMMDETWLPRGELNHAWYYAHLISWVIMVVAIALHVLMSVKVGGAPLLLSIVNWRFRAQDHPAQWPAHIARWQQTAQFGKLNSWLYSASFFGYLEAIVLATVVLAWIISLIKEVS